MVVPRQGGQDGSFLRRGRADPGAWTRAAQCGDRIGGWLVAARRAYASARPHRFCGRGLRRAADARGRLACGCTWRCEGLCGRGLALLRFVDPGRDGRQGAGPEGVEQGAEFGAHAAHLAAEQPERRQMQQPPPTLGAQKPQYHRDDTGEGFSQVLGAVAGDVVHGDEYTSPLMASQGEISELSGIIPTPPGPCPTAPTGAPSGAGSPT